MVIPWSSLRTKDTQITVTGLSLTLRPVPRESDDGGASMIESMWSSVCSSMQLAQDCAGMEDLGMPASNPNEGIDQFAKLIDSGEWRVVAGVVGFLGIGQDVGHTRGFFETPWNYQKEFPFFLVDCTKISN